VAREKTGIGAEGGRAERERECTGEERGRKRGEGARERGSEGAREQEREARRKREGGND